MTPEERAERRVRVLEKVRRAGPWPLSMLAATQGFRRRRPLLLRLLPWALVLAALFLLIRYDVDLGPSSLERIYEQATGKRSPARPPGH